MIQVFICEIIINIHIWSRKRYNDIRRYIDP